MPGTGLQGLSVRSAVVQANKGQNRPSPQQSPRSSLITALTDSFLHPPWRPLWPSPRPARQGQPPRPEGAHSLLISFPLNKGGHGAYRPQPSPCSSNQGAVGNCRSTNWSRCPHGRPLVGQPALAPHWLPPQAPPCCSPCHWTEPAVRSRTPSASRRRWLPYPLPFVPGSVSAGWLGSSHPPPPPLSELSALRLGEPLPSPRSPLADRRAALPIGPRPQAPPPHPVPHSTPFSRLSSLPWAWRLRFPLGEAAARASGAARRGAAGWGQRSGWGAAGSCPAAAGWSGPSGLRRRWVLSPVPTAAAARPTEGSATATCAACPHPTHRSARRERSAARARPAAVRGRWGGSSARLGGVGRTGQRLRAGLGSERAEGSRRASGWAGGSCGGAPRKFGSLSPGGGLEPGGPAGNSGRAAPPVWDAWLSGLAVPVLLDFCGFKLESRCRVTGPCFNRKQKLVPWRCSVTTGAMFPLSRNFLIRESEGFCSSCCVTAVLLCVCAFRAPLVFLQSTKLLCDTVSGSPKGSPSNMELLVLEAHAWYCCWRKAFPAGVPRIAPCFPLQFLRESSCRHRVNQVENWWRLKAQFLFFFHDLSLNQIVSCIAFPGWAPTGLPWHSGADSTLLGVSNRGRLQCLCLAAVSVYAGLLLRKLRRWQSCFADTKNCSL